MPSKCLWSVAVLLLVAAAGSSAQEQPADPPPAPLPFKIATIFAQNAIISTQEGQKASAALTAKFAPQKDALERKQREVQAIQDQLKRGQATMTAEARNRLNQSMDAKSKEAQRLAEDSQAALEEEDGNMLQQLGEKLLAVIADFAQRNGYAAVFDVSNPQGAVLWGSPSIDVTTEIVKLYDQLHPVAPTPPPARK